MSNTDWRNPVPSNPIGEREESPRTLRFPKDLAARITAVAKEQGQDFTTTCLYLLKAACDEVEAHRPDTKRSKAS